MQTTYAFSSRRYPPTVVCVCIVLVSLFGSRISHAQEITFISGNVGTTMWYDTIVIVGDVTVLPGATLTIWPGTQVQFVDGGATKFTFTVNGTLTVIGTAAEPVSFEAFGGNAPGVWSSLRLRYMASIQHAEFSGAIQTIRLENNAEVSLADVDFLDFTQADIAVAGANAPTISGGLSGSRITGPVVSELMNVTNSILRHSNSPGEFEMGVGFHLFDTSTYHLRLDSTAAFDFMTAEKSVVIDAAILDLDVSQLSAVPGHSFKILDKTSAGAINGTFAGLAEGTQFREGAFNFQITYVGGDGNDIVLLIVPEPTAALLLLCSAVPFCCRRKRTAC